MSRTTKILLAISILTVLVLSGAAKVLLSKTYDVGYILMNK